MPFFSIIIPLYNKENYIEYTLKSVLNQSFIDFEIIIVNDGSTDNSEQIVFQFNDKRIHYFHKKMKVFLLLEILELNRQNQILFVFWMPMIFGMKII
ncbi:glycosyl transferase, group 2 family protein [Flavobacterium psychrophilum]|nr:glycosyl transferase, group 2 family protein [Flavobacterium psychrophilum]